MVQIAEREKTYLIPVEDTPDPDSKWMQTKEIPVRYKEFTLPNDLTIFINLRFSLNHQPSSLDVIAGSDGDVEIAGRRIRAQMRSRYERALAVLQTPNPYPAAELEAEQYGPYFSPVK